MKQVYQKDRYGNKTAFEVADDIADTLTATRRAIWRNDARERYYRAASLNAMTDHDERTSCAAADPEALYIAAEERTELRQRLAAALKSLTPEQIRLVKMLKSGMSVTAIAAKLGVGKSAVSNMRIRIQEKIKKYLN